MFKIIEGDFKNNKYSNEEYLDNWPMLYILEYGKKAYIGESNHVKTRMTQHTTNEEKRIFNKVHFIYSRLFNQSVTFDYESKLIQYIVADELFQVTNKNSGIADKQYYEKGKYDKKFELLWRKLQQEKLVKHSLEEIENSDLFKYSPYKELNDSQRKAVEDILAQNERGKVKSVVVNGKTGSVKTIVAAIGLYANYLSGYQCALMAPTEVLATQHYSKLKKTFEAYDMTIALLTGSLTLKEKKEIYEGLESGAIDLVIGTHALFQESVHYKKLGFVVTDEQHRFGVKQRKALKQKGEGVDFLVMSATPIPRTLAMSLYGDMDVSSIETRPEGRKPI